MRIAFLPSARTLPLGGLLLLVARAVAHPTAFEFSVTRLGTTVARNAVAELQFLRDCEAVKQWVETTLGTSIPQQQDLIAFLKVVLHVSEVEGRSMVVGLCHLRMGVRRGISELAWKVQRLTHAQDGVALCHLMNAIVPGSCRYTKSEHAFKVCPHLSTIRHDTTLPHTLLH